LSQQKIMDLLIQEPAPDTTRLASVGCWFDPATREACEIRAPAGVNRYMIWSGVISRAMDGHGAMWDLAPIWTGLRDTSFSGGDVVHLAISRLGEGARYRAMRLARLSEERGEYCRTLFDGAELIHASSSAEVSESTPLSADWAYTLVTPDGAPWRETLENLNDDEIGFGGGGVIHVNVINQSLLTRMLGLGVVILSQSDKRYAPFPIIYSPRTIGDELIEILSAEYGGLDVISDEDDWRAFD